MKINFGWAQDGDRDIGIDKNHEHFAAELWHDGEEISDSRGMCLVDLQGGGGDYVMHNSCILSQSLWTI